MAVVTSSIDRVRAGALFRVAGHPAASSAAGGGECRACQAVDFPPRFHPTNWMEAVCRDSGTGWKFGWTGTKIRRREDG